MIRPHLQQLPRYPLPTGYHLRTARDGDAMEWARLWWLVGEFATQELALTRFSEEIAVQPVEMARRCLMLEDDEGHVIGTGTAWFDPDFEGADAGRVHWIAIDPAWQGRGLGKPLVVAVLTLLARWHTRAFLWTHTNCARAVGIYLDFGFLPHCTAPEHPGHWRQMAAQLPHPALDAFRSGGEHGTS